MIIKFLPVGTGDPKRAVSYLLGELDHKGDKRADVEILEGDPFTFSALAESASFKYCYLCTRQISQNPYPIRILPS